MSRNEDEKEWIEKIGSFVNQGNYEEALKCIDEALKINPKDAELWYSKGVVLGELRRFQEALTCYDTSLGLSSNFTKEKAFYNKGNILHESGKFEEALICYNHALEINSKYPEFWQNKGLAFEELERFSEAISCFDHALELDPKNIDIWNAKGTSLAKLGKPEEALNCFNTVLEINPNHILTLNNKGIAFNSLNKYEEALTCYDIALEINPKCAQSWHLKGYALLALRRADMAKKCFKHVIELDPGSDIAFDAIKMIDEIKNKEVEKQDASRSTTSPEETLAEVMNLCENDPDQGLKIIEKMLKEKPDVVSDPFGKFAKALAYGSKGLFQLARSKSEIDFFAFDQEELRDDLGITDGHLDYLEKALQEIKEMEELHPGFLQLIGTKEDRIGELKVDAMALVLERCRPGRVQQTLGKTKLKYFGPRRFVYIDQLVNISWGKEKASQEELQNFSDIFFSFPSTVRMASIMDYGQGSDGRKYIHCLFYRRTRDDPAPGESIDEMYITVGNLYFFNDRTFGNNPPGEYIEQQKEEPVREKQPSKKGFFRKII